MIFRYFRSNFRLIYIGIILPLVSCQPRFEPAITQEEIRGHIEFLASDSLKGRYPGTPEDRTLLEYITGNYRDAGLILYKRTGIQAFHIATDLELGPDNAFEFGDYSLEPGEDYLPLPVTASGEHTGELVFAGYGFQIEDGEIGWSDYARVDVSGNWVMLLRGVPGDQEPSSPYFNYSEDRAKALLASDLGAAGVLFVSGTSYDAADRLDSLSGRQHPLSIPVVQVKRKAANRLLSAAGTDSIEALEKKLTGDLSPNTLETDLEVRLSVDVQPSRVQTANTLARLKGSDPALREEWVVLGAHHDHLGMGGEGSSSRAPGEEGIHYGADDNASGVAGILEISEYLVAHPSGRSILFATFGAEEMGLIGSRHLAENPPVELDMVQAMINLDMVGRLNENRQLQVGGVGTSPAFRPLIDSLNTSYGFNIKFSNEGYGPSDHASFYAKNVPVLFFSTGAHSDYHTPADDPESINLEGTAEVYRFVADVTAELSNRKERIAFTEAGPKVRSSSRGRYGGITLGLMPDVTYDGSNGMPVMFVTEGKPAAAGGIQKGDTITAIEGKRVGNVYDYMSRLEDLQEGMDIVVTVKRGDEAIDLVVRI